MIKELWLYSFLWNHFYARTTNQFFPPSFGEQCNQNSKWFTAQGVPGMGGGCVPVGMRVFCTFPVTEIQAALPSTSKPDEVLPRAGKYQKKNNTWSLGNSLTVFFNKTCLGYEKYQLSRAYLLSAS